MTDMTPELWQRAQDLQARCFDQGLQISWRMIAKKLNVPQHVARNLLFSLNNIDTLVSGVAKDPITVAGLKEANSRLQATLVAHEQEMAKAYRLLQIETDLSARELAPPKWMRPKVTDRSRGVITAVLSDLHADERVDPAQMEWVNGYDREIAERRLQRFFEGVVTTGHSVLPQSKTDGVILPIIGDIVSGQIHEELRETNEFPTGATVFHYAEQIASGLNLLLEEFGRVFVPCIVGNHGRLDKRVRFKNRVKDNWDWVLYQVLATYFKNNKHITFYIPDSPDASWPVYDFTYRATHGDQFRGGNGIAGIFSPILRGDHKKRKRQASVGAPYDYLIIGHWHQLLDMGKIVCNGSIKGYDEFASGNNFEFERPQQALWLTTPDDGKTIFSPILVDAADEPWQSGRGFTGGGLGVL